jgi:hypothetical protein
MSMIISKKIEFGRWNTDSRADSSLFEGETALAGQKAIARAAGGKILHG